MSVAGRTTQSSFVVLQIGKRRLAMRSDSVVELAPPVRLHKFPHTSPLISGVIVRRGRVVPVLDAASVLIGRAVSSQRFFMIARRRIGKADDFVALPVNGECELTSGDLHPAAESSPDYISGTLLISNESVDVLDVDVFASGCSSAESAPNPAETPQ